MPQVTWARLCQIRGGAWATLLGELRQCILYSWTQNCHWWTHLHSDGKLRILVKAQPSTPSTWPLSPTRLGIGPQDLGLPNKYTLGHCGLSVASYQTQTCFRKQALLTTHSYMTRQHSTKLLYFFFKSIFKVPTNTWGAPPGHILTNLIIEMGFCQYIDFCFHASSLPCLHTFWHAIPKSFYIIYFLVYM